MVLGGLQWMGEGDGDVKRGWCKGRHTGQGRGQAGGLGDRSGGAAAFRAGLGGLEGSQGGGGSWGVRSLSAEKRAGHWVASRWEGRVLGGRPCS